MNERVLLDRDIPPRELGQATTYVDLLRLGTSHRARALRHTYRTHVAHVTRQALEAGQLERPLTCEDCGAPGLIEAHHHDYDEPLSVRFLCTTCHGEADARRHKRERPLLDRGDERPTISRSQPEPLMRIEDVAAHCGVSEQRVRAWMKTCGFPYLQITSHTLRFRRSEIDEWIRRETEEATND